MLSHVLQRGNVALQRSSFSLFLWNALEGQTSRDATGQVDPRKTEKSKRFKMRIAQLHSAHRCKQWLAIFWRRLTKHDWKRCTAVLVSPGPMCFIVFCILIVSEQSNRRPRPRKSAGKINESPARTSHSSQESICIGSPLFHSPNPYTLRQPQSCHLAREK